MVQMTAVERLYSSIVANSDFEMRRQKIMKRRRTVGMSILLVAPVLMVFALKSFGLPWSGAIWINFLCWTVVIVRWRMREGAWPWQSFRR